MATNEQRVAEGAKLQRLSAHSIRTASKPEGADAGRGMRELANAAQFLSNVAVTKVQHDSIEDRNTGTAAFYANKTRKELEATGISTAGLEAYDGVLAKDRVTSRTRDIINRIDGEFATMDPSAFAEQEQAAWREISKDMTDGQLKIANGAWQGHLQSVVTSQYAANVAYKKTQILDTFESTISNKLGAQDVVGALHSIKTMVDGELPGIDRETSRTRATQFMVGRLQQGDDTLYNEYLMGGQDALDSLTQPQRRQLLTAKSNLEKTNANKANYAYSAEMAEHSAQLKTLDAVDPIEYANKSIAIMTKHGIPIDAADMSKLFDSAFGHNADVLRREDLAAIADAKSDKSRAEATERATLRAEQATERATLRAEQAARERLALAVIDNLVNVGISEGRSGDDLNKIVEHAGKTLGIDEKTITAAQTGLVKAKTAIVKKQYNKAVSEADAKAKKEAKELPWAQSALDGTLHTLTASQRETAIARVHASIDSTAHKLFPGDDQEAETNRASFVMEQKLNLWTKNNVVDTKQRAEFNTVLSLSTSEILKKDPTTGELGLPARVVEALQQYSVMYQENPRLAIQHVTDPNAQVWAHAAANGGPDLLATIQETVLSKGLDNKESRQAAINAFNTKESQEHLDEAVDDVLSSVNEKSILDYIPFRDTKYNTDQNSASLWEMLPFTDDAPSDDDAIEEFGPVIKERVRALAVDIKTRNPFMNTDTAVEMASEQVFSRSNRVGNTILYTPKGKKTPVELAGFEGLPKDTMHNTVMHIIPDMIYKHARDGGFKTNALSIPGDLTRWFVEAGAGPERADEVMGTDLMKTLFQKKLGHTYITQLGDDSGIAIRLRDNPDRLPAIILTWDQINKSYHEYNDTRNAEVNREATQ